MSDTPTSLRRTGTFVALRLTKGERQQLLQVATREGDSISAIVREALYLTYGVGAFETNSLCPPSRGYTPP